MTIEQRRMYIQKLRKAPKCSMTTRAIEEQEAAIWWDSQERCPAFRCLVGHERETVIRKFNEDRKPSRKDQQLADELHTNKRFLEDLWQR